MKIKIFGMLANSFFMFFRYFESISMAYIPPHNKHSRDMEKPSPTPELLASRFNRKLNLNSRPFRNKVDRSGKIVYSDQAISKWFTVGSTSDGNQFPSCVNLEPFSVETIERARGEKPLALVNTNLSRGVKEEEGEVERRPWECIVEKILQDLLSSVERVKNEMNQELKDVKPNLVVRVGKNLFHGSPEIIRNELPTETTLRQLKRSFYTNVSGTYMDNITEQVIPLIGVEFKEEKDVYHVKLSDVKRPNATLSCKCIVVPKLNNLELYKIELNQVRHMVADISCLKANLDMRLMLSAKRNLTKLTDDEMESIVELLKSAVIDQDVKGGLRWPLGKASSGDRFRVIGVWHTLAKSYVNPFTRLKIRNADRFDFRTSVGEATREVTLKLKQVTSELLREKVENEVISDMLNEQMKMIWKYFVCCESSSAAFVSA